MGEPVTNKPADENDKIHLVYQIGAGTVLPINLPVTEGGPPGCYAKAGILLDNVVDGGKSISAGFGMQDVNTVGKLFPDASTSNPGTFTTNNRKDFELQGGSFTRGNFAMTDSGRVWFTTRTGSYFGIGLGWKTTETQGGTVFGKTFDGESSGKRWGLSLSKDNRGELEFSPASWFHIVVQGGLKFAATHRFGGSDELQEYPGSALGVQAYLGAMLEFGEPGFKLKKGKEYDNLDIAWHAAEELFDIPYKIILYNDFDKQQAKAQEALREWTGEDSGTGGGNAWMVPPLQSVMTWLGANSSVKPVEYHLKARRLWWLGTLVTAAKAGIYTGMGAGGKPEHITLLSSGFEAINNLFTIGTYEIGINEKYLFAVGQILGGAEILLSGLFDRHSALGTSLMNAGTITTAGWSQNPERGTKSFVESRNHRYAPAGYKFFGDKTGLLGSYSVQNNFGIFFTSFDIASPALMLSNTASLVVNQYSEPSNHLAYSDNEVPSYITSSFGLQKAFDLGESAFLRLAAGLGVMTVYSSRGRDAGGAIKALLELGFRINPNLSIILGGQAKWFKTFRGHGLTVEPSIGWETRF